MRVVLAAAMSMAAGLAAADEIACTFDQECFDGEDCAETAFSLTIEYDTPGERSELTGGTVVEQFAARLITDAETVVGSLTVPVDDSGFARVFGSEPASSVGHLLWIDATEPAQYDAIFPEDDFYIRYIGSCEDVPG